MARGPARPSPPRPSPPRSSPEEEKDPAAPDAGTAGQEPVDRYPPPEQMSGLGAADAAHALAEMERRQAGTPERQARPRNRVLSGLALVFLILAVLVIAGGVWGLVS